MNKDFDTVFRLRKLLGAYKGADFVARPLRDWCWAQVKPLIRFTDEYQIMAEKMADWSQFKTVHILIKMDEDDDKVEVDGQLTAESIKLISESMGISNLNDEAINLLIDDGTYRLKQLAQVSDVLHQFTCISSCFKHNWAT